MILCYKTFHQILRFLGRYVTAFHHQRLTVKKQFTSKKDVKVPLTYSVSLAPIYLSSIENIKEMFCAAVLMSGR